MMIDFDGLPVDEVWAIIDQMTPEQRQRIAESFARQPEDDSAPVR